MFTYNILSTEILQNTDYANYTFELLLNDVVLSKNSIYSIKISEKDRIFEELTDNLIIT